MKEIERMISRCQFYVGKDVLIEWTNPAHDWPSYRVISVDKKKHGITIKGIPDQKGIPHKGNTFSVPIADIKSIEEFKR